MIIAAISLESNHWWTSSLELNSLLININKENLLKHKTEMELWVQADCELLTLMNSFTWIELFVKKHK